MIKKVLILLFFAIQAARAEYRVYQYIVKNKVATASDPTGRIIVSTMDPVAYLAYSGGGDLLSIDLLRTWKCPGFTGADTPTCQSPYGEIPREALQ